MCPASAAAITCRGPVWEFADRFQKNLARSRRLSINWFSRSRLTTVAPHSPSTSACFTAPHDEGDLCRHRRSSIDPAMGKQRPDYSSHLVSQRDPHKHTRFACHHAGQPRSRHRTFAGGPTGNCARPNDEQTSQRSFSHPRGLAQPFLAAAGVLDCRTTQPCGKVAPSSEGRGRWCQRDQGCCGDSPVTRNGH